MPEVYRKEIVPAPIDEFFRKMNAKPKVNEELTYDPTTLSFKTTLKEEKPGQLSARCTSSGRSSLGEVKRGCSGWKR